MSSPLDVHVIRKHFVFPGAGRIATNDAASTQPPRELLELHGALAPQYENVHRGQSSASQCMTRRFEAACDDIARFDALADASDYPPPAGVVPRPSAPRAARATSHARGRARQRQVADSQPAPRGQVTRSTPRSDCVGARLQERLMNEGGAVEQGATGPGAEPKPRHASQVLVGSGEYRSQRLGVAALYPPDQPGERSLLVHRHILSRSLIGSPPRWMSGFPDGSRSH